MLQGKFIPFFQESRFSVLKSPRPNTIREPQTKITADEGLQIALVVAEAGYYGGDIERIFNARGDYVIDVYNFIKFRNDYDAEVRRLNDKG